MQHATAVVHTFFSMFAASLFIDLICDVTCSFSFVSQMSMAGRLEKIGDGGQEIG